VRDGSVASRTALVSSAVSSKEAIIRSFIRVATKNGCAIHPASSYPAFISARTAKGTLHVTLNELCWEGARNRQLTRRANLGKQVKGGPNTALSCLL
jgi:hypothetical protein